MIKQKIKDAADYAKKIKVELKEMEKQYAEMMNRKMQIPACKEALIMELKQVGNNSNSFEDIEKNTDEIHKKLELLDKEKDLLVQKIVFSDRKTAEQRDELDVALESLNNTRKEFIDKLQAILLSKKEFIEMLVEIKSAQYAIAAASGGRLIDDYAWIWEVADSINDSDEQDEKILKIFCV